MGELVVKQSLPRVGSFSGIVKAPAKLGGKSDLDSHAQQGSCSDERPWI